MSSSGVSTDMAVRVEGLGKRYEVYPRPSDRLKQSLTFGRRRYFNEFWALKDISFEVKKGEALGIIGRNGSGKSTLLQILAGTLQATEGEVEVNGRVAALLELGSGFNLEFTGRENAYLNATILGLTSKEIDERYDEIASFADIGDYINQPVKTYSTGMLMRLAFAVQVQVDPEILIVDEALAVGDVLFQKRCYQKMEEMRSRGVTLLFVSHDQESVRTLTSHSILLHDGHIRSRGASAEVLLDYRRLLHQAEKDYFARQIGSHTLKPASNGSPPQSAPSADSAAVPSANGGSRSSQLSFGDLDAEIARVEVLNSQGEECSVFSPNDKIVVRITAKLNRSMNHLNVGLRIRNKEGVKIYSWGTFNQDVNTRNGKCEGPLFWDRQFAAGETVRVAFEFDCRLGTNLYEVQALVAEEQEPFYGSQRMLHWVDEAAFFQVMVSQQEYFFGGLCDLRMKSYACDGP